MNSKDNVIMDKCPVDGELFEKIPANRVYCSKECKRKGDHINRRAKAQAKLDEQDRVRRKAENEAFKRKLRRAANAGEKLPTPRVYKPKSKWPLAIKVIILVAIIALVIALN